MLHRTIATFIVLFWLTMTGLLIHQQVRPGDSALREVPVSHVVKLFFRPRKDKEPPLHIYSESLHRLGALREIIPSTDERTQSFCLTIRGEIQLIVPGEKSQRIALHGQCELTKALAVRRLQLAVTTHMPSEMTSQVDLVPAENVAHFEVRSAEGALERHDYTLDEAGARNALAQIGITPEMLPPLDQRHTDAGFKATARLSSFPVEGGEIDTYLVSVESNGQTILECHVDQIGRIVHVDLPLFGYSLDQRIMSKGGPAF